MAMRRAVENCEHQRSPKKKPAPQRVRLDLICLALLFKTAPLLFGQ